MLIRRHLLDALEPMRATWDRLLADGVVRWIGASVYTPDEALRAFACDAITCVQVPTSILDRRFLASLSFYAMLAHTRIHVRAYLDAADATFAVLADAIRSGDMLARVGNRPAVAGFGRLTN